MTPERKEEILNGWLFDAIDRLTGFCKEATSSPKIWKKHRHYVEEQVKWMTFILEKDLEIEKGTKRGERLKWAYDWHMKTMASLH